MTEKDLEIQSLRRLAEALEAENANLKAAISTLAEMVTSTAKAVAEAAEGLAGGKE